MGNSAAYFKAVFQSADNPSTEEPTPTCSTVQNLMDPRSPTVEFSRTPIEVESLPLRIRSRSNPTQETASIYPTLHGSYINSNNVDDLSQVEDVMEKVCRLHLVSSDPRSPSVGIVRTPIQVSSTPDDSFRKCSQQDSSPSDSLVTATSLASLEELIFPSDESPSTSGNKCKLKLLDPRSPSMEVIRTPIQVECLPHVSKKVVDNNGTSKLKEVSEPNSDEISVINCKKITLDDSEVYKDAMHKQLQHWKPAVEKVTPTKWNKENADCLVKKLFGTPDSKEPFTQTSVKVRTPLRTVSANDNSPLQILRIKQSRGINQEMGRMSGIENAPPDVLNKCDSLQQKNKQHPKYMSSEWDKDSTVII